MKFDNIELLSEYMSAKDKIKCKCKICGDIWESTTSSLLSGHSCPKCGSVTEEDKLKRVLNNFQNKLIDKGLDEKIEILNIGDYKNNHTILHCKCKICGHLWTTPAYNLFAQRYTQCPNYRKHNNYKHPTYKDLAGMIFGKLMVIKRAIPSTKTKHIYWLCQCECGNQTIVRSQHLKEGKIQSCGCINSKMEYNVICFLNKNHIKFELHKTFEDLLGIGNGRLSYDFYLPQYNLLIECQGKQHYQQIEYFGGEEQFAIQQEHDRRKKEYVERQKINFLEIEYFDINNIETRIQDKIFNILQLNCELFKQ